MANQPIAPARRLVAAIIGTVAVFVVVFGLGMTSWAIVVMGLAVLALAIALGVVNVVRRGSRAWVAGTAQVKAISDPPASTAYGRAELQIVVVAPGLPITEVLVRDPRVPVNKWPRLGETLPVMVDVEDMRRVRIDWPNAPDIADPPPPGQPYSDLPVADDPLDEYDDDLLGPLPPPPWAGGAQWSPEETSPTSPPAPPPPGDPGDGPRTIDGELVGPGEPAPPLPRRGTRPSPRPRSGAATATVEPETVPDDDVAAGYAPPDPSSPTSSPPMAEPAAAAAAHTPAAESAAADADASPEAGAAATSSAPAPAGPADQAAPAPAPAAADEAAPAAAPAPSEASPAAFASAPVDDDIDLPLDPRPPTPSTVAPPPGDVPRFVPPPREKPAAESDSGSAATPAGSAHRNSSSPTPASPAPPTDAPTTPAATTPAPATPGPAHPGAVDGPRRRRSGDQRPRHAGGRHR